MKTAIIVLAAAPTLSFSIGFAADFVKGKVVEVDQAARTVTLEHGDISNLGMPGMTMSFLVGEDVDITRLKPGTAIEFTADSIDGGIIVTGVR
jgi:Cu/Ag efflux protein CusF